MEKYCFYCMNIKNDSAICEHCGHSAVNDTEVYAHHLSPGTVLNQRYLIGRAIGEGGFGITYIGRDLKLDMVIAVKEYYPNGYANRNSDASLDVTVTGNTNNDFFEKGKAKFINEARVLAKFSGNKSIVDVRDYFEDNNTAYIVMEYIEGITLKEYIHQHGTFDSEEIFTKMIPLFQSLEKVHNNGLIHRDISPDNIMILKDGSLKLMDFGAARDVNFEDKKSLSIMLRPGYAPEEQYRSKGQQGPWTDVYAICATIYKCITGVTPDDSMERVFSDELKKPSELGVNISVDYENALIKGMAVYQKDRIQNMNELLKMIPDTQNNEVKSLNISTDISTGDSDNDKTEYYEDDDKTEYYSENNSSETTLDSKLKKKEKPNKKDKSSKKIPVGTRKKRIIIAVSAALLVCLLILPAIIFANIKGSHQPNSPKGTTASSNIETVASTLAPLSATKITPDGINIDSDDVTVSSVGIIYTKDNKYGVMSLDGKTDTGAKYSYAKQANGDFTGYVAVYNESKNENDINVCGLLDSNCNELIEAKYGYIEALSERYAKVVIAKEVTDDKNKALFTQDGSMYSGEWYIYDIKANKLVYDNPFTESEYVSWVKGQYIEILPKGSYSWIISSDGETITDGRKIFDDGSYILEMNGSAQVYSTDNEKLFEFSITDYEIDRIENGYYVAYSESSGTKKYFLIDKTGKTVSAEFDKSIAEVATQILLAGDKLYTFNGDDFLTGETFDSLIITKSTGNIFKDAYSISQDDEYYILDTQGNILYYNDSSNRQAGFNVSSYIEGKINYYCFSKGDYSIQGASIDDWLISQGSNVKDLVETRTGKTIIQNYFKYTSVKDEINGKQYIVAYNSINGTYLPGSFDVYEISVTASPATADSYDKAESKKSTKEITIGNISNNGIITIEQAEVSYDGFYYAYNDGWVIDFEGIVIYGEFNYLRELSDDEESDWGHGGSLYTSNGDEYEVIDDDNELNELAFWSDKDSKQFSVKIPNNIKPGKYKISLYQFLSDNFEESTIEFTVS